MEDLESMVAAMRISGGVNNRKASRNTSSKEVNEDGEDYTHQPGRIKLKGKEKNGGKTTKYKNIRDDNIDRKGFISTSSYPRYKANSSRNNDNNDNNNGRPKVSSNNANKSNGLLNDHDRIRNNKHKEKIHYN